MKKIVREYIRLLTLVAKEKQFNKKVDLNKELQKFGRLHKLSYVGPSYVTNDFGEVMLNGCLACRLVPVWTKHKVNGEYKVIKYEIHFLTT